jgi:hypothetical protein
MGGSSADSGDATPSVILQQYNSGEVVNVMAAPLLRDESAWYHCVVRFDSTQSTDTNRVRIYINGVESPSYTKYDGGTVIYPNQNADSTIGGATEHYIAKAFGVSDKDGAYYLADFNYCDGQSLAPSSFGEFKSDIWVPKNTSGLTFGDNGFRMEFKQTGTGTNSSGMGADTSGNDNHYAVSGLAATDVSADTPTNNFCLPNTSNKSNDIVFSEGNTKAVYSTYSQSPNGTIGASSGKWYYEVKMAGTHARFGFCESHCPQGDADTSTTFPLYAVYSNGSNGLTVYNSVTEKASTANSGYTSFSDGDTLGIAFDIDNGKFYAHLNGTYYNSGDPAGGTGALITSITAQKGGIFLPYLNCGTDSSRTFEFNFGAPSHAISSGNADGNGYGNFEYAVPSGFLSLCTANLPDPVATIDPAKGGSPQDYFSADIFTGNGTNQDIDIGFVPNLVWTRQRTDASGGAWMDSVRGDDAYFQTPNTNAEGNFANITFTSTGYNVSGNSNIDNEASHNYVGWAWKAETAFSNDASATGVGALDSAGTINTDVGFAIIGYTGTGSATTIAHGLGKKPQFIIAKNREGSDNWRCYAESIGATKRLQLHDNSSAGSSSSTWNNTEPTTAVFSVGSADETNHSSEGMIAYLFTSIDGYSSIGGYKGNANSDGSFVHCGFRPEMVIIKSTSATESWNIFDTSRDPSNLTTQNLNSNSTNAESDASSGARAIDILSNGFKARGTNSAVNDGTFFYIAFAKQPFKYANAR